VEGLRHAANTRAWLLCPAGIQIDIVSSLLSVLTVFTYMVSIKTAGAGYSTETVAILPADGHTSSAYAIMTAVCGPTLTARNAHPFSIFPASQVETALPDYHPVYQSLRQVDLVCSCLFVLEWAFWLWLAHDRWRYVFSKQSILDLGTTIPIFVSFVMHRDVSVPSWLTSHMPASFAVVAAQSAVATDSNACSHSCTHYTSHCSAFDAFRCS
jgi:hypothetical protein